MHVTSPDIFCSAKRAFQEERWSVWVCVFLCRGGGVGRGCCSSFGDIISDRTTKEELGRESCFHTTCFHSSPLPVQWNSWWSLNEAELGDQADTGTSVDGICELHLPSLHPGESSHGQLTWMKLREREPRWKEKEGRGGAGGVGGVERGGAERDKGMKYLLNVIISNHL